MKEIYMRNKGLLLATTPLTSDGLTKIELDVIEYNKDIISFDIACGAELKSNYQTLLNAYNVKFYKLPNKKNVFSYMLAIWKLVNKNKYDFVYIHGNSAMMLLEAMPSKVAGVRVITHCHNTKSNYPIVHRLVKPLFNKVVDDKIGCSVLASQWAYSGRNIRCIVNGVDIERFKYNEENRKDYRKKLGWEKKQIIGHIGRFSYQKNHKRLVDIFDVYCRAFPDARLLLIGDGDLRDVIQKQIEDYGLTDKVKIIQHTDTPEKYMSAMDIFVMPSWFEGFGLVALEAQANGVPTLLDTLFSPETFATDCCNAIALDETNDVWVNEINRCMKKGRLDCTEQLITKGFEQSVMMKKIQEVLLNGL